ncbi:MAG: hypothetical protein HY909_16520 [Deltaproteobacteria bacterium]|nr:hypothetical protein [Deltaproteobacteria bacterium]
MRPREWFFAAALVVAPGAAWADPPGWLDRAVVAEAARRAVDRAGLSPLEARALAARARRSSWLPQVSVRVARGAGLTLTSTAANPTDRATADDSLVLDVRLTLSLNELVFHPQEVTLARAELVRAQRRMALETQVVELLAVLERHRLAALEAPPGAPPDPEAALEEALARARVELLTGVALETRRRAAER